MKPSVKMHNELDENEISVNVSSWTTITLFVQLDDLLIQHPFQTFFFSILDRIASVPDRTMMKLLPNAVCVKHDLNKNHDKLI